MPETPEIRHAIDQAREAAMMASRATAYWNEKLHDANVEGRAFAERLERVRLAVRKKEEELQQLRSNASTLEDNIHRARERVVEAQRQRDKAMNTHDSAVMEMQRLEVDRLRPAPLRPPLPTARY